MISQIAVMARHGLDKHWLSHPGDLADPLRVPVTRPWMLNCGQMKTVNSSQDVYDQGDYFFSLAAAAVNPMPLELRLNLRREHINAISAIQAVAGR